jgi:tetratricopeptide (TPR) repeat protein
LSGLVRNEKGVRDLFALLTVAKGALRQDEVEELTGLFALDLVDLPHQVTRWFSIGKTRSSADMPTADMATYSFAHPLLAEEFRRHLGKEARQMEERLLKWCENWREHPSFPYILRHYAEHLYEKCPMTNERMTNEQMTNYAELCRLALDSDFKQAQTEHLPDEPNLPLKTVQLALKVAIQLEDALMMARLLMEHAKRAQIEAETPLQAWRRGHREREWRREHQERALRMATDIVFQRNHKLGTLWGLLLAWVAESEGKSEEERSWSKRFLDEVRKRWEGGKLEKLRDWDWEGKMAAFLLGELGQVEGAIEVAGLVLDDVSKRELAASLASKELFEQALKVAEGIEGAWERARALREIAGEMAKAGMIDWAKEVFEQALKVAEGIGWARWRSEALREIAGEMAKAGMMERAKEVFDQAQKVAEGIEWASERSNALRAIAERMVRAGEVEGAVGIVEREMAVRTKGLPSVLKALAERAKQGDGRSKEGFLRLLPLCGWSLEFAYKACGLLAWLYPERGEEIAGVVRGE